jgi:glutathione S-transferase
MRLNALRLHHPCKRSPQQSCLAELAIARVPLYAPIAMKLYTFAISHFSEKVRWALDHVGIPYEERVLLPGLHMLTTKRLAKGTSVPILEHDGKIIQGSSQILDHLRDALGATALEPSAAEVSENRALEALFDEAFGLGMQRLLYGALLEADRNAITTLWSEAGPWWARGYFAFMYPAVARAVSRMYKTGDEAALVRAHDRLRTALDAADERLSKRPYLDGESLGRTDITLAALLAPLAQVAEHPCTPISNTRMPAAFAEQMRTHFERPAMRHVHALYREHRYSGIPYRLGRGGVHRPVSATQSRQ